ncbi:MAG: phosphopantetheine-binding protein [Candidatus Omnitrophota bacterium]
MVDNREEEIRKMISEIIEVEEEKIGLDADFFTDLGVDSLKAIEIVAAFEKKYRVIILEKDIPKIRTLRQILDYTKNLNI